MNTSLVLPELGLAGFPVTVSVWHVEVGSEVTAGDRLLEIVAGGVTVDLPSPASGVLAKTFVQEDDELQTGQLLAVIEDGPTATTS
jgi:pyruvate/2-oxoglutarate dehydrogenase complex dihydrolipoamide acyltransferase (E2) component